MMFANIRKGVLEFGTDRFFVGSNVRISLRGNPGINFPYYKFGGICEVVGTIQRIDGDRDIVNVSILDCKHLESPCFEKPNKLEISTFDIDNIVSATVRPRERRMGYGRADKMFKRHVQL